MSKLLSEKRTVQLFVPKEASVYRNNPMRLLCPESERLGTFITGQHIDPSDPTTHNNLTLDEMTGKKMLSDEKRARFPYVLNPHDYIVIKHGQTLDLSTFDDGSAFSPKDVATYEALRYQSTVCYGYDSYNQSRHNLIVVDNQKIAEMKVIKDKKMGKAFYLIESKATTSSYSDILTLLNYYVKGFNVNPAELSSIEIEEKILSACEEHPQQVIDCFGKNAEIDLYVLKLIKYAILERRISGDIYEGDHYIGRSLSDVRDFMFNLDNKDSVNKWGNLLRKIEKDVVLPVFNKKEEDTAQSTFEKAHTEFYRSLESGEMRKANGLLLTLKQYSTEADEFLVVKAQEAIAEKKRKAELDAYSEKLQGKKDEELFSLCDGRKKKDWEGLSREELIIYLVKIKGDQLNA